jgi:hypothetical protein
MSNGSMEISGNSWKSRQIHVNRKRSDSREQTQDEYKQKFILSLCVHYKLQQSYAGDFEKK